MPDAYPYTISNNKVEPILAKIRSAARPERFSRETLSTWGFTASNDRAMLAVLKGLGFLTDSGVPTEFYDRLRDPNDWKYVLADRMRDLYSDLFATDTNIQAAPEAEIRGAMARITGKDDETVKRYYATFKALAGLATFSPKPTKKGGAPDDAIVTPPSAPAASPREGVAEDRPVSGNGRTAPAEFHYNIQIHLPATTDIAVYNAIFKSMREHLPV